MLIHTNVEFLYDGSLFVSYGASFINKKLF